MTTSSSVRMCSVRLSYFVTDGGVCDPHPAQRLLTFPDRGLRSRVALFRGPHHLHARSRGFNDDSISVSRRLVHLWHTFPPSHDVA